MASSATVQEIIDKRSLTASEGIIFRKLYGTVPPAVLGLPRERRKEAEGCGGMKVGIAAGKYSIPGDIDAMNDEIAEMFGV